MTESFSDRHGLRGAEPEITIREDAPEGLRFAIPLIAQAAGMLPKGIRRVICEVLLIAPNANNWSDYPNVWDEITGLIADCPWFKVYDIAEALYADLDRREPGGSANTFATRLNQFFRENGIGWEMQKGLVIFRGSEPFMEATRQAQEALSKVGRSRAASEVHEALRDISRRPQPDVTGAVHHAIAALECVARDTTGQPNPTLGKLIPRLKLSPPLDAAVEKLWGYASGRARHVQEGQSIGTEEAELVVTVACALCTFISKRQS